MTKKSIGSPMLMSELLGVVLDACAKAQEQTVAEGYEGFRKTGIADGKLAKVRFSYVREGTNCVIDVPLFLLVPQRAMQIESLTMDFGLDVSCVQTEDYSLSDSFRLFKTRFRTSTEESASAHSEAQKMQVTLKLGQAPMPAGLSKILQISAESFQAKEAETANKVS